MLYVTHLGSLRTEEKFNNFYDRVIQDSSLLTEEPKLPRPRKIQKRLLYGGATTHQFPTPNDRYRHAILKH